MTSTTTSSHYTVPTAGLSILSQFRSARRQVPTRLDTSAVNKNYRNVMDDIRKGKHGDEAMVLPNERVQRINQGIRNRNRAQVPVRQEQVRSVDLTDYFWGD